MHNLNFNNNDRAGGGEEDNNKNITYEDKQILQQLRQNDNNVFKYENVDDDKDTFIPTMFDELGFSTNNINNEYKLPTLNSSSLLKKSSTITPPHNNEEEKNNRQQLYKSTIQNNNLSNTIMEPHLINPETKEKKFLKDSIYITKKNINNTNNSKYPILKKSNNNISFSSTVSRLNKIKEKTNSEWYNQQHNIKPKNYKQKDNDEDTLNVKQQQNSTTNNSSLLQPLSFFKNIFSKNKNNNNTIIEKNKMLFFIFSTLLIVSIITWIIFYTNVIKNNNNNIQESSYSSHPTKIVDNDKEENKKNNRRKKKQRLDDNNGRRLANVKSRFEKVKKQKPETKYKTKIQNNKNNKSL